MEMVNVPWAETQVLKEPGDADRRLAELTLDRAGLLKVRDIALAEAANATPNHCANAAGTFSYQHGTRALRDRFIGPNWKIDRSGGVEAIFNRTLGVRVAFCNVDAACSDDHLPVPRSAKGGGAERLCEENGLFGSLPHFAPTPPDTCATFYLMVAGNGACELSCPIVAEGTFRAFVERIYLSDGGDLGGDRLPLDDDDAIVDFDPRVTRKA